MVVNCDLVKCFNLLYVSNFLLNCPEDKLEKSFNCKVENQSRVLIEGLSDYKDVWLVAVITKQQFHDYLINNTNIYHIKDTELFGLLRQPIILQNSTNLTIGGRLSKKVTLPTLDIRYAGVKYVDLSPQRSTKFYNGIISSGCLSIVSLSRREITGFVASCQI